MDKAAENTTVDMPKALVENELDIQMERFGYQLQMSGYSHGAVRQDDGRRRQHHAQRFPSRR